MDFQFTPEDEAFRQELRDFIKQELPADWNDPSAGAQDAEDRWRASRAFTKKLARKGWLTMAWPQQYGGMGVGHMRQLIYNEELAYHRAPGTTMGVDRVGPTIMLFGNDEQKQRFLPPIVADEVWWCQGFSEPSSGSDLASLQTRAVEEGDYFTVSGQKIWTSNAHRADWIILLARTDPDAPKHRGISFFLVDMRSPGITVQPLVNMLGSHEFNQVFFDNVRVPKENLIGEKNRGWYVAAATLDFERSGIQRVVGGLRTLEEVTEYACETRHDGSRLIDDHRVRNKLAELKIEFEIGKLLSYRVAWMQSQGLIPNYEASTSKLFGSELQQRLANFAINLMGLPGQLGPGSRWAPLKGRIERYYLSTVSLTIAAGTSEVQRNIIATRGLGLPRG